MTVQDMIQERINYEQAEIKDGEISLGNHMHSYTLSILQMLMMDVKRNEQDEAPVKLCYFTGKAIGGPTKCTEVCDCAPHETCKYGALYKVSTDGLTASKKLAEDHKCMTMREKADFDSRSVYPIKGGFISTEQAEHRGTGVTMNMMKQQILDQTGYCACGSMSIPVGMQCGRCGAVRAEVGA